MTFYSPVNTTSRDIRLLTLHPGEWQDDIHCDLFVASLDKNPDYQTLSYTWGDSTSTKPLFINSIEVRATQNLEAALRHIRHNAVSLTLWVDAICINQDNSAERTHQVSMMGQIYKSCTHCYMWLGCPDEYFKNDQRTPTEPVLDICELIFIHNHGFH